MATNGAGKKSSSGRSASSSSTRPSTKAAAKPKGKSSRKNKPPRKKGWNYPRAGYGKVRRWVPSWRVVFGSFFGMLALGIGAFLGLYASTEVPEPDDFALAQTTNVYYSGGDTQLGTFSEVHRTSIPVDTMPEELKLAVVASEDRRFFTNNGVDLKGIARALINNLLGKPTQGGSTLTQQYAERYYMGTTKSILGKVKEAVLAIKIDNEQSKDEILGNYLNTIYFGRGAYGVEAAAQAYFGIPAADLNLEQSALLAAVIPAPSNWDPAVNPTRAEERWGRVLRLMLEDEHITQAQFDAATLPETITKSASNRMAGTNGYILAAVKNELMTEAGFTEDQINTAGFTVETTIDPVAQQAAVDAVNKLPIDRPENNYVGLVSMDPTNGEIKALYGGADYLTRQRSTATQDRAQGGSTFKVFGLVAALDNGVKLNDRFSAPAEYTVDKGEPSEWTFRNVDQRSHGNPTLVEMTKGSINTPYIKMNEEVGPEKAKEAAIKLGLSEDTPGLDSNIGNVLGSASVTPMEMVRVFGTIANQGERATPHIIRTVKDKDGNVVYRGKTETERVYSAEVMAQATYAMQAVTSAGGTAEVASEVGRPVAGKTGTSTGPVSAWFGGFTPNLVTVVDMFQSGPDGSEEILTPFDGEYQVAGGNFPAEVWRDYMRVALQGMPVVEFPEVSAADRGVTTPRRTTPARTTEPPTTEAPTTEAPTTEAPTTEAPVTEAPTTEAPVTEAPTTHAPPATTEAPQPTTPAPSDPTTPAAGSANGTNPNANPNAATRGNR